MKLTLSVLLLSGLITTVVAQTTQDTYLGKIKYQDQTLTKASAAKLNRQIDLQRASQLTLWAMPITSMYQSHKAAKANLGYIDDEVVIGLYEGYDGSLVERVFGLQQPPSGRTPTPPSPKWRMRGRGWRL